MSSDRFKYRISGWFNADAKMRWGLLLAVAVAFTVIFYPNLVIKKKHLFSWRCCPEGY